MFSWEYPLSCCEKIPLLNPTIFRGDYRPRAPKCRSGTTLQALRCGNDLFKASAGGGEPVNHKPVERLYRQESLQIHLQHGKTVALADRQSLFRPCVASAVWSIEVVFASVLEETATEPKPY